MMKKKLRIIMLIFITLSTLIIFLFSFNIFDEASNNKMFLSSDYVAITNADEQFAFTTNMLITVIVSAVIVLSIISYTIWFINFRNKKNEVNSSEKTSNNQNEKNISDKVNDPKLKVSKLDSLVTTDQSQLIADGKVGVLLENDVNDILNVFELESENNDKVLDTGENEKMKVSTLTPPSDDDIIIEMKDDCLLIDFPNVIHSGDDGHEIKPLFSDEEIKKNTDEFFEKLNVCNETNDWNLDLENQDSNIDQLNKVIESEVKAEIKKDYEEYAKEKEIEKILDDPNTIKIDVFSNDETINNSWDFKFDENNENSENKDSDKVTASDVDVKTEKITVENDAGENVDVLSEVEIESDDNDVFDNHGENVFDTNLDTKDISTWFDQEDLEDNK